MSKIAAAEFLLIVTTQANEQQEKYSNPISVPWDTVVGISLGSAGSNGRRNLTTLPPNDGRPPEEMEELWK